MGSEVCDPLAPEMSTMEKLKWATEVVAGGATKGLKGLPRAAKRGAAVTLKAVTRGVVGTARAIERHAPPTDQECRFNWEANGLGDDDEGGSGGSSGDGDGSGGGLHFCEPADRCTFQYTFGDFHPGRSCRLRLETTTSQELEGGE